MHRTLNKHKYIYKAVCKDSPGFLVKVPDKGSVIQQWFLFSTHGGEDITLNEAIKWRDKICKQTNRDFWGKANSIGKGMYGLAGIILTTEKRKRLLKNGNLKIYSSPIIRITGARINGKLQYKKIYLSTFNSLDEAFQTALLIRNNFIKQMNQA